MTRFRITTTYELDASPETIGRMCDDISGTIADGFRSKMLATEEATLISGARFSVVANPRPRRKK